MNPLIKRSFDNLKSTIDLDVFNSLIRNCTEHSHDAFEHEVGMLFTLFLSTGEAPPMSFFEWRCEHDLGYYSKEYKLLIKIIKYAALYHACCRPLEGLLKDLKL